MTIAQLRDKIKTSILGVALQSPFASYDYMEGYLFDMNTQHDRVNPLCILNIIKSTNDRIRPFTDHVIRLNFIYNVTEAMQTETLADSQDYLHTLFSKYDTDINATLIAIFANDDLNCKSSITRTRSPYNSTQRLWLIQVEFTLNTASECLL
jgi:hypothetical protein